MLIYASSFLALWLYGRIAVELAMQAVERIGEVFPYYRLARIIAIPCAARVVRSRGPKPWARGRQAAELYLCLVFPKLEDLKILGLEPIEFIS
jgi:hypothetical protein